MALQGSVVSLHAVQSNRYRDHSNKEALGSKTECFTPSGSCNVHFPLDRNCMFFIWKTGKSDGSETAISIFKSPNFESTNIISVA